MFLTLTENQKEYRNMKKFCLRFILTWVAVSAFSLYSNPIEIAVGDTGFEDIKDGRPEKYNVTGGELQLSTEKRSGKYGGKYIMAKGAPLNALWIRHDFPTPVRYGDTYTIKVWAKGQGKVTYLVSGYSGGMWKRSIWGQDFKTLTKDWKLYSWKFKVDFSYMNSVRPGFQFTGGGYAVLDDISMTYDPADNDGRILPKEAPKNTILPFNFSFHDAEGTVKINGKTVKELKVGDGLNVMEVALRPTGKNPYFKLETPPEYALCNGAWKEAPANVSGNSASIKFDDSAWQEVQVDKTGKVVPRNKKATSYFRTVILWNRDYYAKESMVHRRQKEWLLPAGSTQLLKLKLAPDPMERDYKKALYVELYLPDGVSLMNTKQKKARYVLNQEPGIQQCGSVKIENGIYQKYLLSWTPAQLAKYPNGNQYPEARIPLHVSADAKVNKTAAIRFARLAPGRFSEILKTIPVRFYPPVNGRQPQRIMIQTYVGVPLSGYSTFPEDVLTALVEQAAKTGVNTVLGAKYFPGYEYLDKCLHKAYDKTGIKRYIWTDNNFPLHSLFMYSYTDMHEQHKKNPDAQAKYFPTKATIQWGTPVIGTMYCPSYMLDVPEGRTFFRNMVKKGLQHEIQTAYKPVGIFFDYEEEVWRSTGNIPGNGSYCFCNRCRNQFGKQLNLASTPSPQEIKDKYYEKWEQFRSQQNRRIHAVIHDICKNLGFKMMFYTQSHMKSYFSTSEGPFDYLFLGHPAKYAINRENQEEQDKYVANLKPDYRGIIAQVFTEPSTFGPGNAMDGNPDGYFVPSRWKGIILRLIATYRVGVDISAYTEFCGGIGYYIGEATRAIAELEDFFVKGKRTDVCPEVMNMKYPDLLGLEWNGKKIILLFNENAKSKKITLNLKKHQKARAFYSKIKNKQIVIPPENAEILIIEKK